MGQEIPDICRNNCEALWGQAAQGKPNIDVFPHGVEKQHPNADIEFGGEALQVGRGAVRIYSINNECGACGDEDYGENWSFRCPNSK